MIHEFHWSFYMFWMFSVCVSSWFPLALFLPRTKFLINLQKRTSDLCSIAKTLAHSWFMPTQGDARILLSLSLVLSLSLSLSPPSLLRLWEAVLWLSLLSLTSHSPNSHSLASAFFACELFSQHCRLKKIYVPSETAVCQVIHATDEHHLC